MQRQFPIKLIESASIQLPVALSSIQASFPSPAENYLEESLDLGQYLAKHPKFTFFMRVDGDSMIGIGINAGDLLVIDRAENARDGPVIVTRIRDEFCVKQLRIIDGRYWLY